MKISSAGNLANPMNTSSGDPVLNGLIKAKERLLGQIEKLKTDNAMDGKTKQEKIKQLQTQLSEIENQIRERQAEKMKEAKGADVSKSNKAAQTDEENKNKKGMGLKESQQILSSLTPKEKLENGSEQTVDAANAENGPMANKSLHKLRSSEMPIKKRIVFSPNRKLDIEI